MTIRQWMNAMVVMALVVVAVRLDRWSRAYWRRRAEGATMGNRGGRSSRSQFVSIGLAYVVCACIFMGLAMVLSRSRGSDWRGWELVAVGIPVIAMALVLLGLSLLTGLFFLTWDLLTWAFSRDWPSRPKRGSFAKTFRGSGVWDRQLDE
jgi:hypothetical protein